ncbi:hypothetical protein [Thermopirellula anaerolimosa]
MARKDGSSQRTLAPGRLEVMPTSIDGGECRMTGKVAVSAEYSRTSNMRWELRAP